MHDLSFVISRRFEKENRSLDKDCMFQPKLALEKNSNPNQVKKIGAQSKLYFIEEIEDEDREKSDSI